MKVFVPKETITGECRVAIVPEAAAKLIKLGLEVQVQSNAGLQAGCHDDEYLSLIHI